jgi:ferritin
MEAFNMLISPELNDAINAQIGREFGASLQYVSIATYFDSLSLRKLAGFFYKQAEEERDHAMKFVRYIVDAGGEVHIPPIDAPQSTFKSAEDYIARTFLDWFELEQLEEVSTMDNLLRVVRMAGERNLIMLEAYISHNGDED